MARERQRQTLRFVPGKAILVVAGVMGVGTNGMDMSWITDRLAVGGGIWVDEKMAEIKAMGITHVIDMQIEFDDTPLGVRHGVEVLWNPVDDDFQPKPPDIFKRGVKFAMEAFRSAHDTKLYIHCAAGVHRAPMMALAVLRAQGHALEEAKHMIQSQRYVVDFADVYVRSVEKFMKNYSGR